MNLAPPNPFFLLRDSQATEASPCKPLMKKKKKEKEKEKMSKHSNRFSQIHSFDTQMPEVLKKKRPKETQESDIPTLSPVSIFPYP